MTILAFWPVGSGIDRHAFDCCSHEDAFKQLWSDGTRGEHCTDDVIMCEGDCSACAEVGGGCWGAKNGQTILFEAH